MASVRNIETMCGHARTREENQDFGFNTDSLERERSIVSLIARLQPVWQGELGSAWVCCLDKTMAEAYSACDLTLGIGPEGFGFPLVESQFCGTPVVTGIIRWRSRRCSAGVAG